MSEEEEGLLAELQSGGVVIRWLGGNCPVQAEGTIDGVVEFYFRARGDEWRIHIGPDRARFTKDEWTYGEPYGEWPAAGWITREEALQFIALGIEKWRKRR